MAYEAEDRLTQTNRVFRAANEQIRARSAEYDDPLDRIPFLCECPQAECTTIVRLSAEEYGSVRAEPSRFFTAVGHEEAEGSPAGVVARHDGYVIVERSGT